MTDTTGEVADALAALVATGVSADLDEPAVRAEGAAFAAALCETAPGAESAWAATFGLAPSDLARRASTGRDWRRHPTPALEHLVASGSPQARPYAQALARLASAACSLGDPSLRVIDVATFAASAQLRAAGLGPDPAQFLAAPIAPAATTAPPPGVEAAIQPATEPAAQVTSGALPAAQAPAPPPTLEALLAELDSLVGLEQVKQDVRRQAELLRVAKLRSGKGLRSPDITRHLVFVGNPGTGKTTVARLVAGIYHALGLLAGGQLVECDRSGLVAGYVGQTAIKTAEVAARAHGGVLFVDEAYALATDDFGREAIDILVKEMEDHRDELIVIVAGYPALMTAFIEANPGLESRFRLTMHFVDYSDDQLIAIFQRIASAADFTPSPECLSELGQILAAVPHDEGFGNARFVRSVFEEAVVRQAWRLRKVADPTVEQLRSLQPGDLEVAGDGGGGDDDGDGGDDHGGDDHGGDDHGGDVIPTGAAPAGAPPEPAA